VFSELPGAVMIELELYPDEYLRVIRARLEMTQAELARRLGVERRTVLRYENGIFKIPKELLEAVKRMAENTTP
jgi:transcriptional regulator with XRE-family HTH domain